MKNSYVLFEGQSVLDGKPIVVIATGFAQASSNVKTGNMIQTFIMRSDIEPHQAVKSGDDVTVCGNCVHRPSNGGACYVRTDQAPLSVYRAWKRGNVPVMQDFSMFENKLVRAGTYGDPAAVPMYVWRAVMRHAVANTGYTHQVEHKNFDMDILSFCMVSADTPKQAKKYHSHKLRTFRVKVEGAPTLENEVVCKADSEGLTCAQCKLCDGATKDNVSIVIDIHGAKQKRYTEKFSKANFAV